MVFDSPPFSFKVTLYTSARTWNEVVERTARDWRPANVFDTGEAFSATELTDMAAHADAILAFLEKFLEQGFQRRLTGCPARVALKDSGKPHPDGFGVAGMSNPPVGWLLG